MPTTSPDSIYYADGTTPASLADITSAMATSIQNAFNVREIQSFSWANSTAKSAQVGMIIGDIGYQIDNLVYYRWNGSTWKIWAKAPAAYVPSFGVNLTPTSTSVNFSVASGVVTVSGIITNSTTTTSGITMTMPTGFNIDTTYVSTTTFVHTLGDATFFDTSASAAYAGAACANSATAVQFARYVASTANLTYGAIGGATNPFGAAWASGDLITFNFSYPVA
jgi:hypothetical protein